MLVGPVVLVEGGEDGKRHLGCATMAEIRVSVPYGNTCTTSQIPPGPTVGVAALGSSAELGPLLISRVVVVDVVAR